MADKDESYMETKGTKGDDIMKKGTRTILMSSALAACVLAVVTGCGQVRPEEKQSESTTVQTEPAQVVTEAPIVIQTEAPQTEPQTQAPETQAPETQAPETQAPETQAPAPQQTAPASLSEEEELNQLYEFAQEEIGTRFANADINVRQTPSTEGDNIISSLDKGEEITVIGETANWYEIFKAEDSVTGTTDLKGFVMKYYLSDTYDEAMAAQPSETAAPAQTQPAEQQTAEPATAPEQNTQLEQNTQPEQQAAPASSASGPQITVTSDANIRSDAYETASVVGVVNKGTTVTQLESSDGWVKIDYNGKQGYIKSSMVG